MWLTVGVLLGSVVPFTLLVIKPVNDALMQGGDVSRPELGTLLVRWSYLHWARTVASGACIPFVPRGSPSARVA